MRVTPCFCLVLFASILSVSHAQERSVARGGPPPASPQTELIRRAVEEYHDIKRRLDTGWTPEAEAAPDLEAVFSMRRRLRELAGLLESQTVRDLRATKRLFPSLLWPDVVGFLNSSLQDEEGCIRLIFREDGLFSQLGTDVLFAERLLVNDYPNQAVPYLLSVLASSYEPRLLEQTRAEHRMLAHRVLSELLADVIPVALGAWEGADDTMRRELITLFQTSKSALARAFLRERFAKDLHGELRQLADRASAILDHTVEPSAPRTLLELGFTLLENPNACFDTRIWWTRPEPTASFLERLRYEHVSVHWHAYELARRCFAAAEGPPRSTWLPLQDEEFLARRNLGWALAIAGCHAWASPIPMPSSEETWRRGLPRGDGLEERRGTFMNEFPERFVLRLFSKGTLRAAITWAEEHERPVVATHLRRELDRR